MRYPFLVPFVYLGLLGAVGCAPPDEDGDRTDPAAFHRQVTAVGRLDDPAWFSEPALPFEDETGADAATPAAEPAAPAFGSAPNPFNPTTEFTFAVPQGGAAVSLEIHGVDGRKVRHLVADDLPAGPHRLAWRGRDDEGRRLPSGVYIARLRNGKKVLIRKLVLVQ